MTMTGARQILSFTLGSLFAHWGSPSHANDKTAYERELDRLRRRAARCEAAGRDTQEKCLVGLTKSRDRTKGAASWSG
jgi:hypothetical protein